MILIIAVIIIINSAFQTDDFSTGSTTDKGQNKSILQKFLFKAGEIIRLEEGEFQFYPIFIISYNATDNEYDDTKETEIKIEQS